MENVNPILANALSLLKQGSTELAEKEFARAATACCTMFGEVCMNLRAAMTIQSENTGVRMHRY